ncbi:MAG TPA: DUF4157 domain-containing protein [Streptosporangiaceae bacterium]|nr:DUF4157 domain-containing protein [Streptosporangiaceae bacterium]
MPTAAGLAQRPAGKQTVRPADVSRAPAAPSARPARGPDAAARPSRVPLRPPEDTGRRGGVGLAPSRSPVPRSPGRIQRCGTGSSCGCDRYGGTAIQGLTVGPHGDRFEQEAERVANAISRGERDPVGETITPLLQRQPAEDEGAEEDDEQEAPGGQVRARPSGTRAAPALPPWFAGRLRQAESGGEPLAAAVRAPMEAAFGASFAAVRTHSDASATQMSRAIGAAAFTHGSHIFIGPGGFDPHGREGRRLLAHELTHVLQQKPRVAEHGSVLARAPASVLQRDEQQGGQQQAGQQQSGQQQGSQQQGLGGGDVPAGTTGRKVLVSFIGDGGQPILTLPFSTTAFDSLEPGFYDCSLQNQPGSVKGQLRAEGLSSPYTAHEGFTGGWQKLLGLTRRTVLVITDDTGKLDTGEKKEKKEESGTGDEPAEPGKATSGSKYGMFGLLHLPKWFGKALDKTIETLGMDDEMKEIKALLTALKELYEHRTELGSLFTEEKLLGVLFGLEGGTGIEALGAWASKPGRKIAVAGKKGLAGVAAKLLKVLEVLRKILRPIFAIRRALTAATQGLATILDEVPELENLLAAGDEERKTPDFGELLEGVVDDISQRVKASLEAARGHVSLIAETLADQDYVTYEELARAIAVVAEKFLPTAAKAVTATASKLGIDIPGGIADHIIAPLIPKSALDEVNGVVRGALSNLEPLIKAVTGAMDEILAGIEAEVHDDLAPELKTLFAQLSPADGSAGHGLVPAGHVEPELAASAGQPLPPSLREQFAGDLGIDFADVRVHADAHAGRAADSLDAKAFTIGRDVFFGPGRYAPAAPDGRRLLAHELTHVVQQASGEPAEIISRAPKDTVKRNLGQALVKPVAGGVRALLKPSADIVKRGKAITTYVNKKVLKHRVGTVPLPDDAYIYVRDKKNNPVGIRRRLRFVVVVPALKIVKNIIEPGLGLLDPVKRWQKNQRSKLRRALGCGAGEQAHHVIPLELWGPLGVGGNRVVAAAVRGGFSFNGTENGICLEEEVHEGPHARYTARVERSLEAFDGLSAAEQLAGVRKVAAYQQKALATRQDKLD